MEYARYVLVVISMMLFTSTVSPTSIYPAWPLGIFKLIVLQQIELLLNPMKIKEIVCD